MLFDGNLFSKVSFLKSGYQAELWKDILKERLEKSLRTTVFLDTTGTNPFCSKLTFFNK